MIKIFSIFKNLKVMSLIGGLLLFIGLIGVVPTLYFRWTHTGTASASPITASQVWGQVNSAVKASSNEKLVTGFPVSISIPGERNALNMNVPIVPGYYNKNNGSWSLSLSDAQFAVMTSQPNNISGNTFIYGHYRPAVFAYLHLIKPGVVATITTNNGYVFSYRYINTYAVQPNNTSALVNSDVPVLTVQTCSGSFFQNRQMYIFSYIGYRKI